MKANWTGEVRDAYHKLFGVPDYEAYLAHMRLNHPEKPPLERRAFASQWIDRRYGGMRSRCC
jgi:uncharacterized short protein YbdD (DUF466 family)